MTYAEAMARLEAGNLVRRQSWGSDRYLSQFEWGKPWLDEPQQDEGGKRILDHAAIGNGQQSVQTWAASEEDRTATDWQYRSSAPLRPEWHKEP